MHSDPTHGPTRIATSAPPSRCPLAPGRIGKLIIWTAKTNAVTSPAIGAVRSSRSARARVRRDGQPDDGEEAEQPPRWARSPARRSCAWRGPWHRPRRAPPVGTPVPLVDRSGSVHPAAKDVRRGQSGRPRTGCRPDRRRQVGLGRLVAAQAARRRSRSSRRAASFEMPYRARRRSRPTAQQPPDREVDAADLQVRRVAELLDERLLLLVDRRLVVRRDGSRGRCGTPRGSRAGRGTPRTAAAASTGRDP